MSAHTAGPWSRWVGHGTIGAGVTKNTRGVFDCARTIAEMVEDDDDEPLSGEDLANANLIAAAPDLLAALKHAVGCAATERCDECVAGHRAIAKAEGKS